MYAIWIKMSKDAFQMRIAKPPTDYLASSQYTMASVYLAAPQKNTTDISYN